MFKFDEKKCYEIISITNYCIHFLFLKYAFKYIIKETKEMYYGICIHILRFFTY